MAELPPRVSEDIAFHLDAIRFHFKSPRVTLLIRPDLGPGKDADVLLTDDDPAAIIAAVKRLTGAAESKDPTP